MCDEPSGQHQGRFKAVVIRLVRLDTRKPMAALPRCFVGLSAKKTAQALDMPGGTVDNGWRFARAWMCRQVARGQSHLSQEDRADD